MIAILDYGAGNLFNVQKALEALGAESKITRVKKEIQDAEKLILPGVGAFPDAMEHLSSCGLVEVIQEEVKKGKWFMGICLGMQLLFAKGEEITPCPGLGLLPGVVEKIPTTQKVPHMGWNSLHFLKEHPVFRDIPEGSYFYFVHSFRGNPAFREDLIATTEYGCEVAAAVGRENMIGLQFHPEKSSTVGLKLLKNFVEMK